MYGYGFGDLWGWCRKIWRFGHFYMHSWQSYRVLNGEVHLFTAQAGQVHVSTATMAECHPR
ncbi:MAG: hypothetical protein PHE53_05335 [Thermoguttaceae bacterium]|nr:hypothetical protein [Thermoguttaceae bacterium]